MPNGNWAALLPMVSLMRSVGRSRLCRHIGSSRPIQRSLEELTERLKRGPVTFHLKAQLAAPGDSPSDPAQPWPEERKVVDFGTLTINKAAANSAERRRHWLFLPGQLIDGIEPSDDPLIDVRNRAYAVSFSRRNP